MKNKISEQQIFDLIVQRMGLSDIIDELPAEKLAFDTPIFESADPDGLALDSIAALELVVLLQENFGIKIQDEDLQRLTSVTNIAKFIEEKKE